MLAFILGHVDCSDQIGWIVISQTLYITAVSMGCLVLGLWMSSQATLCLLQQHLLSRKYIHSFSHCGHFDVWCLLLAACLFTPVPTTSK